MYKRQVYNPSGLNVIDCFQSLQESNEKDWGNHGGTEISNEDLLKLNVNVLAPAAIENVIHDKNANDIQAKLILELANGPIKNAAEKVLEKKGTIIVPDILANAGGVVVSYFEWLQNRHAEEWDIERVEHLLKSKMQLATEKVMALKFEHDISIRTATYVLALERISNANECLGNSKYFKS